MSINGIDNISFANSLGTIEFQRCLIGLIDQWSWNGRSIKRVKNINIQGHVQRATPTEGFEAIFTGDNDSGKGDRGTLALPWAILTDVSPLSIEYSNDPWLDFVPVTATFRDDEPDSNLYSMHWFDLILHNPKIQFPVAERRLKDYYVQMPLNGSAYIDSDSHYWGPLRVRPPHERMSFQVTGTLKMEEVPGLLGNVKAEPSPTLTPPQRLAFIADQIQQRRGTSSETLTGGPAVGWPRTFMLTDAIPELDDDLDIAHCFVASASARWDVEKNTTSVAINLMAPPQKIWKDV